MSSMTFGARREGVKYTERPAAYAVVGGPNGTVAAVRGTAGMIGLPGAVLCQAKRPKRRLCVRSVKNWPAASDW